jgi:hypothetical protein
MLQQTKLNNWLVAKFTNQNINELKNNPSNKLSVIIDENLKLNTINYYDALKHNAYLMSEIFPPPYDVLFSGGIDSEIIVRTNHNLGIKQNVYIFKFEDDINVKDVTNAKLVTEELGIKLNIIDFHLKKFFENDAERIYKETFAPLPENLPRLFWHQYLDNTILTGDGEPYCFRKESNNYNVKSNWVVSFFEYEFLNSLYGRLKRKNVLEWYTFTPDILFSFLQLPIIKKLVNDEMKGKLSSWSSRTLIHHHLYPSIKTKPKYAGYEGLLGNPGDRPEFMDVFKKEVMLGIENSHVEYEIESLEKFTCLK